MSKPVAFVIEDEPDIAQLFMLALEDADFATEVVHNGQRALERLREIVPDMVLLDLSLPSVSGVEILAAIRSDTRLADTAVIVASGNPQMSDEIYDQADLVLIKPVSYEQLRDLGKRFGK